MHDFQIFLAKTLVSSSFRLNKFIALLFSLFFFSKGFFGQLQEKKTYYFKGEMGPIFGPKFCQMRALTKYLFVLLCLPSTVFQSYGDVQLLLVEEDPRCLSGHYFITKGHLGRTTDLPQASWIASSHEEFYALSRV